MIKPRDLIGQASDLIDSDRGRPKQVDLRRSISASYYAVFHTLTQSSVRLLISGSRHQLRARLLRGYPHSRLRKVCTSVANGNRPKGLLDIYPSTPLPSNLRELSELFVTLQEERHEADYDNLRSFLKADAETILNSANRAITIIES